MFRTEKDSLGEKQIPEKALYGIHSLRAKENFPDRTQFPVEWYRAVGKTKLACYRTYKRFSEAARSKYVDKIPLNTVPDSIIDALISGASQVSDGSHFDNFIVPAMQGGAGTSINMNINEIITNLALTSLGYQHGDYQFIDPIEHTNIFQSTNDVIPTALTITVMDLLVSLEENINNLRQKVEEFEKLSRTMVRPGYTQMQEAVPSTFGLLFSAYSEALSRDWWRVSKCAERIKVVNIGGGATGTGLSIPKFFIMEVVPELRKITGYQLAHAENLSDSTSNLDRWVEIHATLKAHAVNLEKMASDIRLLSSDIVSDKLLELPARQVGSSIMPGKINPVISEYVISVSHKIYANDQLISSLSAQGCLELNAYLPSIGVALIESLNLLISANTTFLNNALNGLIINHRAGYEALINSPVITTSLIPFIGYNKSGEIARLMKNDHLSIFEANRQLKFLDELKLKEILEPSNLIKLGYTLEDLL
jgi:aspartate ammonia-lyase